MNIKKGDKVIIVGSAEEATYIGCVFEVLSEPYIVCGSELVKIKCHDTGKYFGGGYATEFLKHTYDDEPILSDEEYELLNKNYIEECKLEAEQPITNGDYMRSIMNDDELAEYINLSPEMGFEVCRYCEYGNTVPDDRGQCLTKNGHCFAQYRSEAMKKWLCKPKENL